MKSALLLVDIQYDFLPTGNLPVPEGDKILPVVNTIFSKFDLIIATQDWHPADHKSFASRHEGRHPGDLIDLNGVKQVLWPDHCVQGSHGAELVGELDSDKIEKVFQKGMDVEIDSYSGFFDNDHQTSTGLGDYLNTAGVTDVYITGLALDYCVKYTALDCVGLGFNTILIEDATRAVNMSPEDGQLAIDEMKRAGVSIISSSELSKTM